MNLRVLHEYKKDWIAFHKPAHMTVYAEQDHKGGAVGSNLLDLVESLYEEKFYPVHRLDKGTCGVVLFARNSMAQKRLKLAFENRQTEKKYEAIVVGAFPEQSECHQSLDGQKASTLFQSLTRPRLIESHEVTWISCQPITGRFHQIRKHLKSLGHPIVGDTQYGVKSVNQIFKEKWDLSRPLLSAVAIRMDGILVYTQPDDDFMEIRRQLFPKASIIKRRDRGHGGLI